MISSVQIATLQSILINFTKEIKVNMNSSIVLSSDQKPQQFGIDAILSGG